MRWQGRRQSGNVEDVRGSGGGGRGMPLIGGGLGSLAILLLVVVMGGDPRVLLQQMGQNQGQNQPGGQQGEQPVDPAQAELKEFVGVVLADTEDVWHELLRQRNVEYREPKLRLFSRNVDSACGFAEAAVGPFYCPADERVYIDLHFFDELHERYRAPGDFAQAYVIAHEVGHHVQNLLGISDKIHRQRGQVSQSEFNALSVRLELQADFFAGVWAHHAERMKQILERGDLEEGLAAASAVGDDRLQKQTRGYVVPDSFTHGTSEQRKRWFLKGFQSGDMSKGDTFNAREL